mmetsp:Transcript_8974/g.24985  ORF Transcript_8974/g.24985 Transcript_8974/m.24985 type:complete len:448 (-) Transcript_8974:255-1598(-)
MMSPSFLAPRDRLLCSFPDVRGAQGLVAEVLLLGLLVQDVRLLCRRDICSLLRGHIVGNHAEGQLVFVHQRMIRRVQPLGRQLRDPRASRDGEDLLSVLTLDEVPEPAHGLLDPLQAIGNGLVADLGRQPLQEVAVEGPGGLLEAVELLLDPSDDGLEQRLELLHQVPVVHASLLGGRDRDILGLQLSLHGAYGVLTRLLPLLVPICAIHLGGLSAQPDTLESLDLPIHVVHIREQGVVLALQMDEDFHNLVDVGDAGGLLDRRESLLEDSNGLFVLLDVPSLDAIQESSLHDPSHHGRLRKLALLGRHDQPSLLLHAILRPLELDFNLLLLEVIVLQISPDLQHLLLEATSVSLPLLRHDRYALLSFALDDEAGSRLLVHVRELAGALPDLQLQPLEDAIELKALPSDQVHLFLEPRVVVPDTIELLDRSIQPVQQGSPRPCFGKQ